MLNRYYALVGAVALFSVVTLPAVAQITPDSTLGNEGSILTEDVEVRGDLADLVEGGATRGGNLFHSFLEFNVDAGQRVYFANPVGIESIFSRVIGSAPSNIFGTLGIDGSADLFLINPNGLVFGKNSSLDVDGSFAATTASSIQFGESESYSAVSPESPSSILSITPSAFFFGQAEPAAIENRSTTFLPGLDPFGNFSPQGLRVPDGESFLLVGGDVNIEGGWITAFGGRIDIGGLAEAGSVNLNFTDGSPSLEFPEDVALADVSITDEGVLLVSSDGSGELIINSGNLRVSGFSRLSAGVLDGATNASDAPGNILLFATGNIVISNGSSVFNDVDSGGQGNSGDVFLNAQQIFINDGSQVGVFMFGEGLTGSVEVKAADTVILEEGVSGSLTGIFAQTNTDTGSNSGDIRLSTRNLEMKNGALIDASTFGQGNSGNIDIEVLESIEISGTGAFSSGIFADVAFGAEGDSSALSVDAGTLKISDGGMLSASTFGTGNSGNINIDVMGEFILTGPARSLIESDIGSFAEGDGGDINIKSATLLLQDGAFLSAEVLGQGDAGDINITTDGDIRVEGIGDPRANTLILNRVSGGAMGDAGDVNILSGGSFLMTNNAQISSSTEGIGDSGNVLIDVKENAYLENATIFTEISDGERSGSEGGIGDGGDITIRSRTLSLLEGSQLRLDTENEGNSGNAFISVDESITIAGRGPGSGSNRDIIVSSAISSTVEGFAIGDGGNINITTGQIEIRDGGFISADTYGQGDSGLILIDVQDSITLLGRSSSGFPSSLSNNVNENATGDGKGISLNAGALILEDGAQIASTMEGNGDAGDVSINVQDNIFLRDAIIITEVTEGLGNGNGGDISIETNVLDLTEGSSLLADTESIGNAGSIFIEATERITLSGRSPLASDPNLIGPSQITTTVEGEAIGDGGDISIGTNALKITDGAFIQTSTFGQGPAGDVNIQVDSLAATNGAQIGAFTRSTDSAGKISVTAANEILISGQDESGPSEITSASFGDAGGNGNLTSITVPVLILTDGAQISAVSEGAGTAGEIDIQVDSLEVLDSNIETNATQSLGGDIRVNALSSEPSGIVILRGDSDITTDSLGDGGNITLNAVVVALDDSDILARSEDERGGNITFGPFFGDTLPIGAISPVENNGRVDISADGQLASGVITAPDTSFVENSLNELSGEFVDTETLTADSCIVSTDDDNTGSFVVTGGEGLPQQPGTAPLAVYPTDDIQSPTTSTAILDIQEAHGVYQLADGRLVLSHECERARSR